MEGKEPMAASGDMPAKRGVFNPDKEKLNHEVIGNLLTDKPIPNGSE